MKRTIVGVGAFLLIIGIVILVFTSVDLPHTTTEPYQVPKSSDIIDESFTVSPDKVLRTRVLTGGDILHVELEVTAGGDKEIDFYVNKTTVELWGQTVTVVNTIVFKADTRVTTVDANWTVPSNGTYHFVYDNSFSWITSKGVTTKVTKHWSETNYRDVTKYYPLIPYEFSYVGLILSLAGIGVLIFGFIK